MDFQFFLTDNKSGYKTKEVWFSKNHPEEYKKLIEYCEPFNLDNFKEKVWFYYHNLTSKPTCKTCGKETKFAGRFDRGYNDFCELKCINDNKEEMNDRIKKSFQEKYGIDYFPQHEDFFKKQRETKLKRYGVENYNNQEKLRKTSLEKWGVDSYTKTTKYRDIMINKVKERYEDLEVCEVSSDFSEFKIKCENCNELYDIKQNLLRTRKKEKLVLCTNCNPTGVNISSSYEYIICSILSEWNVEFIRQYKPFKNKRMSIDIFVPNKNFGIEFDGLYFHSEKFKDNDYHLNKTNMSKELGINLIHIFEDEWIYQREKVISIIKDRLGLNENIINGSECNIVEVSLEDSKNILDKNHIEGYESSSIRVGLEYGGEVVSLLTIKKCGKDCVVSRYCNKMNYSIIGGEGILFNYIKDMYKPKKVVININNRFEDGVRYKNIGFKYKGDIQPNFWYIKNDMRYRRKVSENRIFDCGYNVWYNDYKLLI
jgi:hypothetical protein